MNPGLTAAATAEPDNDAQMVLRVQQGDRRAFDILVLRYQARLLALISRYIQDRDEVRDVTQEAFLKAYRSIKGFRGDSSFYTWLYRIGVSVALNHLASRGHRSRMASQELGETDSGWQHPVLTDHDSPESHLMGAEARQRLQVALQNLPDDLRTVLLLREYEGLAYEEIAQIIDSPVGTVRSRIFRGREQVLRAMRQE